MNIIMNACLVYHSENATNNIKVETENSKFDIAKTDTDMDPLLV